MQFNPSDTIDTGCRDSDGQPILTNSYIKKPCDINQDVHGEWCMFQVLLRGLTPVLSYCFSQTGQAIPKGMTGGLLADEYDLKAFLSQGNIEDCEPIDAIKVMSLDDVQSLMDELKIDK